MAGNGGLGFKDALRFISEKNTKLVWLGVEPKERMSRLLNVSKDKIISMDPERLLYSDEKELSKLENHVFLCYHGNTSAFIARHLRKAHKLSSYHVKGGTADVLGDVL
ncbi:MAG: rhodanese-like domain-containing protein [Candidatus Marsarchaeota archaeon]|nr:rhodanese-like domain-containing protein [Candidatus Marsarchaeota archaeon]